MRISITMTFLILLIGSGFLWQDHQRLAEMRHACAQLRLETSRLGLTLTNATSPRMTKRQRQDRVTSAARIIALLKEIDALPENNEGSARRQTLERESADLTSELDATQFKILITMLREDPGLSQESRETQIFTALTVFLLDQPQAVLEIMSASPTLLGETNGYCGFTLSSALGRLAREDPLAATAWLGKHKDRFPASAVASASGKILSGTAVHDPKLAFQLINELDLKTNNTTIQTIMRTAGTPEQRSAALTALRGHLASLPDEEVRDKAEGDAIRELAGDIARDGFESATQWIASVNLSQGELERMVDGIGYNAKSVDGGSWIEWIDKTLPRDKSEKDIEILVRNWTQKDYRAVADWLGTTPEGPARNTAVRSYAETVSKYDPKTAAQWAATLPPGKDRQLTLKSIYQNWPRKDPADKQAAEAFKQEHGIK